MSKKKKQSSVDLEESIDKNTKKKQQWWPKWVRNVVLLTLAGSLILTGILSYAVTYLIRTDQVTLRDVIATDGFIENLYNNNLILYLDLNNRSKLASYNYWELYEPQLWEQTQKSFSSKLVAEQYLEENDYIYSNLEEQFSNINQYFDYYAKDLKTGTTLTNSGATDGLSSDQYVFYITFLYDVYGNPSLGEIKFGEETDGIRRIAADVMRRGYTSSTTNIEVNNYNDDDPRIIDYVDDYYNNATEDESSGPYIYQCSITYGLTEASWIAMREERMDYSANQYIIVRSIQRLFILLSLGMLVFAFLTRKKLQLDKFPRMDFLLTPYIEIPILLALIVFNEITQIGYFIMSANNGLRNSFSAFLQRYPDSLFCAIIMLLGSWYIGTCAAIIKETKVFPYLRQKSAIAKLFQLMGKKAHKIYQSFQHIDLTQNTRKTILKLIWVNAFILLLISVLWFGGIALIIVYSIILYFILKKYAGDVQTKYGILLEAINEIAQGNLQVTIKEDIGIFEPFKPQIERIQQGFRSAVEEEMKSQRMKTELITNVSHDLKTPLTAIITYIDLLILDEERRMKGMPQPLDPDQETETTATVAEENKQDVTSVVNIQMPEDSLRILTEEKRYEYLITLEKKALRLKVLIEDLFEVSKAASKTVTLQIVDVDIYNLVKQVSLEMSDKFKQANLDLRLSFPEEKMILPLDSQKTYRIYENLFGNIAKYALPGTRVYVNATRTPGGLSITLKNITEQEIDVKPEELTDRFVRGDAARNTEGSGLGLSIAKSFMELQGGKLAIEIDGDLFKAITIWEIR
jgi:signal transduction histidine kinase